MRLLSAVAVGILMALSVVTPAAAANTPSVTIKMDPKYSIEGTIRPIATISGGTSSISGALYFRRYTSVSCADSGQQVGSSVPVNGNNYYEGPNFQTGSTGDYGVRVFFDSSNTSQNSDKWSECKGYLLQKQVTVGIQLTKSVFEVGEKIEPQVALQGATGDAGGQVEFGKWSSAGCGPAKAVSAGIRPVVNGQPQGTVNLQESTLGVRSVRVAYSGDTKNAEAGSACKDYTVGAYLRGKVFQDADGNGTLDAGELGIPGVVVTLQKAQGTATATTNNSGSYEFLVTSAGLYTVQQTQPIGFDSTTSDRLTVTVSAAGSLSTAIDFGEAQVPSTLLPSRTATAEPETTVEAFPERPTTPQSSFAALRLVALGLVVIAALVLLVLVFAARWRRDDEGY